jgi:hypothetical protein
MTYSNRYACPIVFAALAFLVASCGAERVTAPRAAVERLNAAPVGLQGDPPLRLEPGQPMIRFAIKGGGVYQLGDEISIEIRDQNEDLDHYGGDKWAGDARSLVGTPERRGGIGRAPVDDGPIDEQLRTFTFGTGYYDSGDGFESDPQALAARVHRGRIEVFVPPGWIEHQLRRAHVTVSVWRGRFDPATGELPRVVRSVTWSYDTPPERVPLPLPACVELDWRSAEVCE